MVCTQKGGAPRPRPSPPRALRASRRPRAPPPRRPPARRRRRPSSRRRRPPWPRRRRLRRERLGLREDGPRRLVEVVELVLDVARQQDGVLALLQAPLLLERLQEPVRRLRRRVAHRAPVVVADVRVLLARRVAERLEGLDLGLELRDERRAFPVRFSPQFRRVAHLPDVLQPLGILGLRRVVAVALVQPRLRIIETGLEFLLRVVTDVRPQITNHLVPHLVDVRLQFVAHVVRLPYHSILVRHLGLGLEARVELLPRHARDLALDLEGRLLVLALLLGRLRLLGLLLGLLFFLLGLLLLALALVHLLVLLGRLLVGHLLDQLGRRYLDCAVHGMTDVHSDTSGAGRHALDGERADGRRHLVGQLGRIRIGSLDREVL